jgi:ABC-2 type transport system ATP-binding protein
MTFETAPAPAPASGLTPGPAAIEMRQLTRRFGSVTAVDRVSLAVEHGQIFGLLGSNGAGKTTLIKMLTTLLPPSDGQAFVAGVSILAAPAEVRRRIGYVPQMLSADGMLTARENLLFSARLYGVAASDRAPRIAEALQFMGLEEAADRLAKTYSGGMIRRLELAQAMLHRPEVLFLDEPTIGLDPLARHAVWERLQTLRRDFEMTVLLTTHDMEEADVLCDELAILHTGQLAVTGRPAALRAAISPTATLDDVFARHCGGTIAQGGRFADTRAERLVAQRLG